MEQQLREILMHEAKPKGMCRDNYLDLSNCESVGDAIALYKKTIDWALENQYPSLDVLRKHFSDCGKHGVYVGKTFDGETLDAHAIYVFHNCDGWVNVALNETASIIPMLYFANGCRMKIACNKDYIIPIRVPLYIFGDNHIIADSDDRAVYTKYQMEIL